MKIILASGSPRRKLLLEQIGINFETIIPEVDESNDKNLKPAELVEHLAVVKGKWVINKNKKPGFYISADTIVVHNGKILGKPGTTKEAAAMLNVLSGAIHSVFTGCFLAETDEKGVIQKELSFSVETKVTFSDLDKMEIDRYVKSGSPLDKAGAYGIQDDLGALFVKRIDGDYYNVVGFPLNEFYNRLKKNFQNIYDILYP